MNCVGAGNQTSVLWEEQPVHVTGEPSLQPPALDVTVVTGVFGFLALLQRSRYTISTQYMGQQKENMGKLSSFSQKDLW